MPRLLPPAGIPISFGELMRMIGNRRSADSPNPLQRFADGKRWYPTGSGRSALYLALRVLNSIGSADGTEVVIPAYTCFSVAAAVARAGFSIRLVDIDPHNLDFDCTKLEESDLSSSFALVGCNLFGIHNNWSRLHKIAVRHGLRLVDDAAQSLGSAYDGVNSGLLGDVGIFSFDRGKSITAFSGGMIVTDNDEIAERLDFEFDSLSSPGLLHDIITAIKLTIYKMLANPSMYWIPARLPFLGLGKTIYDEEFGVSRLSSMQIGALDLMADRLQDLNDTRRHIAARLIDSIGVDSRYAVPGSDLNELPAYLRLPVVAESRGLRDKLVERLLDAGVSASNMYPSTIAEIPEARGRIVNPSENFPGARRIVECMLTLPTHPWVTEKDIVRMSEIITSA